MIKVIDLSKSFTVHILGGKYIQAFEDISFDVKNGKVMGLAGPSGAGKSSLLKCIYRTYLSTSGKILYQSESLGVVDLVQLSEYSILHLRKHEIGYVTQFLEVLPRITAVDAVAEPLINIGISRTEARERAKALLSRLRISMELFDAFPVTFSGGEKQRVNLARAIISAPRLLLLDEPTASLDKDSVRITLDILHEMKAAGTAMVVIWHDHQLLDELADELFYLNANYPQPVGFAEKIIGLHTA